MIFFIDKPLSRSFARDAVEAIVLDSDRVTSDSESYRSPLLSRSLKTTSDENLLLELAKRGYDLSRLREDADTAAPAGEIVKIG